MIVTGFFIPIRYTVFFPDSRFPIPDSRHTNRLIEAQRRYIDDRIRWG
ncbi:hypothetical protein [Moorena sp. SIO4G3]|nr:hypothetical protein [Moorena sp. SIO4G3]NEO75956.1 hypothetical protein [Moorena sp. SIO4G3]